MALAVAKLRMTPQEVMRHTVYQLNVMLEARVEHVEKPFFRFWAQMTANFINTQGPKKAVTAARLLGEEVDEPEMSEEERMLEAHRIAEKVIARCNGKNSPSATQGETSEGSVPQVEEEVPNA